MGLSWVLRRLFCWVLVFVILTFFKEGIGNILTMPYLGVLGSWVWEMGLGTWDFFGTELVTGNLKGPFNLLRVLNFCIP